MKNSYLYIILALFTSTSLMGRAYFPKDKKKSVNRSTKEVTFLADCVPATSEIDMSINNVRARLLGGGDVWWNLEEGKYIVPKVDPASGQPEVSSIFSGSVWLGGYDEAGNLKLAANANRQGTDTDFWPGPLDPNTGTTERETCAKWDKHFRVYGENIRLFLRDFEAAKANGETLSADDISEDVLGWPARGNPYFRDIHGFDLPNTTQGLAGFFDANNDMEYNPIDGDFPIIEIRGCPLDQYPDEMIFWIYNDAGGIHTQTQGDPIQMEVQVQAFAYATNDELNNMTFQRYKLINRATQDIDSTYFAMWVDPDLGCHQDDYIGCDIEHSLAYIYNEDAVDGISGCDCDGVATYCNNVPILGIDYFRGPRDEFGNEIGMSSFTYYNNGSVGEWPDAQTDPGIAQEYYNYMSGSWRDGSPYTFGGSGYNPQGVPIDYAFTDRPDNPVGWSMCSEDLGFGDRRTIQASGPFKLEPGAVNELIIGVVWLPDITDYPCPSIDPLLFADETAQALFDNCFDITDGPDAPDMDIVELDRELIFLLSNGPNSNNFQEQYEEIDLRAPTDLDDELKKYRFEGYKIFQLSQADVSSTDLNDPEKARVIFQTDIKNGISQIVNWTPLPHPTQPGELYFDPEIKVVGQNEGLQHAFRLTEDQFAVEDRRLVNHRQYYFRVVAYAYNEFEPFDNIRNTGQKLPYIEGRRNIQTYTALPRSISYQELNTMYGDSPVIERLSGLGSSRNFLDLEEGVYDQILNGEDVTLKYKKGRGPIQVQIVNPLDVQPGTYTLRFDQTDPVNDQTTWTMTREGSEDDPITSDHSIGELNAQLIKNFGFTVQVGQVGEPGFFQEDENGFIGFDIIYDDSSKRWLNIIKDGDPSPDPNYPQLYNFVLNDLEEPEYDVDVQQILSQNFGGIVPFIMADYRGRTENYLSPSWLDNGTLIDIVKERTSVRDLNNVDIILTPDKSKWSRCVVVETASRTYYNSQNINGLGLPTIGASKNFDLRSSPSVGKEDNDGDGLPDPDGDGTGMAWFPGYAIDVETGQRLNIFFGENSVYNEDFMAQQSDGSPGIGGDMMWNPDGRQLIETNNGGFEQAFTGGQHYVYVTRSTYDECANYRDRFAKSPIPNRKITALGEITYAFMPLTTQLNSYAEGLIPTETTIKLRVTNPFRVENGNDFNGGYPAFRFTIDDLDPTEITEVKTSEFLEDVNVVPNPYYGFSDYEVSQFSKAVKITNLPPRCIVTIYSLDGKFIRQYKRNEVEILNTDRANAAVVKRQINPDILWDLENQAGIPISSGVYLIHVNAYELGEKTLKWFGVNRKFDPSGL